MCLLGSLCFFYMFFVLQATVNFPDIFFLAPLVIPHFLLEALFFFFTKKYNPYWKEKLILIGILCVLLISLGFYEMHNKNNNNYELMKFAIFGFQFIAVIMSTFIFECFNVKRR